MVAVRARVGGTGDRHAAGEGAGGDHADRVAGDLNAAAGGLDAGGGGSCRKPARRA